MRHCPYNMKTLKRTDHPVEMQPLHKVFVFVNQNVANIKY